MCLERKKKHEAEIWLSLHSPGRTRDFSCYTRFKIHTFILHSGWRAAAASQAGWLAVWPSCSKWCCGCYCCCCYCCHIGNGNCWWIFGQLFLHLHCLRLEEVDQLGIIVCKFNVFLVHTYVARSSVYILAATLHVLWVNLKWITNSPWVEKSTFGVDHRTENVPKRCFFLVNMVLRSGILF